MEYLHGRIYKLTMTNCLFFYFGSTTRTLRERFQEHKQDSKRRPSQKKYQKFTYEKFCAKEIQIELVEEVVVHNVDELHDVEKRYIQCEVNNLNCLNSYIPNHRLTKEERKEYAKNYHIQNFEQIKEQKKKYYQQKKDNISNRNVKYYNDNKDYYHELSHEYYLNNKDIINQRLKCDCGSEVLKRHMIRHQKTKKHQDGITSQQNN